MDELVQRTGAESADLNSVGCRWFHFNEKKLKITSIQPKITVPKSQISYHTGFIQTNVTLRDGNDRMVMLIMVLIVLFNFGSFL